MDNVVVGPSAGGHVRLVVDIRKPRMLKLMRGGEVVAWLQGSLAPAEYVHLFGDSPWELVVRLAERVDGGEGGVIELGERFWRVGGGSDVLTEVR